MEPSKRLTSARSRIGTWRPNGSTDSIPHRNSMYQPSVHAVNTAKFVAKTRAEKRSHRAECFFLINLFHRLIPKSAHGDDLKILAVGKTVAQPVDVGVDRAFIRFRKHPPDFVHELRTGEDLVRVRQELIQQIKLLLRQDGKDTPA